jgi:hypothetical protein
MEWDRDGRHVFVRHRVENRFQVFRVDLQSGLRTLWLELDPDPSGFNAILPMAMTPDGSTYVYTYAVLTRDLYLVSGLR